MKTAAKNKAVSILREKCPNCGKGDVFNKSKKFRLHIPEMKENCDNCGYHFDREPGYFLGAMYISYGLGILQGIIAFFIAKFVFHFNSPFPILALIISVILIFSIWNYRLSRIIWMNIFPN